MTAIYTAAAIVLFAWAVWCIFGRTVEDGLIGRAIYAAIGLDAFAIIAGNDIQQAHHVLLTVCFAALAVRHFMLRTYWPRIRQTLTHEPFNHRRESDGY